jgi:hypothetical protein
MAQFALIPDRPGVPDTVAKAVKLMLVGAALALVEAVALIAVGGDTTPVRIAFAIGGGVFAAGVWWLMARACQLGRSWARVLASVFIGLDTLSLYRFVTGAVQTEVAIIVVLVLIWLVGFASVILLWSRSSSAYFHSTSDT